MERGPNEDTQLILGLVLSSLLKQAKCLILIFSQSCAQSVHQQRRILVKILLSMLFGMVGIKMSVPKPILDQVVQWSAQ